MSTFVLIHGGWHGGWCWRKVAKQLRSAGHDVFTPTLTGMGEREHLWTAEVGLETHTQDVLNLIHFERLSRVVLVGHSYGGTIITLVADQVPAKIDALIYVDAVIPVDQVPGWDSFPPERRHNMLAGASKLGGLRIPPPDPAVWGVSNEEDSAWLRACCSPHPIKTMLDTPRITQAWQTVQKKHYILAGAHANKRFVDHHAAVQGQPGWTSEVIDGGHDLMVTHPSELTQALLRVPMISEISYR
jgi:pimeloyl-ACP methyl ester carboxylesterase